MNKFKYELEMARLPSGILEPVRKFGRGTIGTSWTTISSGGVEYQTPTSAAALEILSSSAADDSDFQVTVFGLDGNWDRQSEVVTLNGTTAVDLANTYTRIYRMYVSRSGDYASGSTASHTSPRWATTCLTSP